MCTLVPIGCLGHKITQIPALVPVNIFSLSIIGGKLKAEKHALCAALRSAACGGALRRCAAPSAAARRFAPPLRGATRPARCARRPFANTKKMPCFLASFPTRDLRATKLNDQTCEVCTVSHSCIRCVTVRWRMHNIRWCLSPLHIAYCKG